MTPCVAGRIGLFYNSFWYYLLKPVTADVFIGAGGGYGDRKRTFIEGHFENFRAYETYGLGKFYFGFKVGYCFGTRKKPDAPADQ